jgi:EAL and modified HD-GYP domain-containing signal transduction protein
MSTLLDVFVGRQPIFNKNLEVYAYELLFRSGNESNHAVILGGDSATAQVVLNAFMEIGLTNLVGEHKAFLNFTEGFLLRENIPLFPRAQLVIEVLETVKPTAAVIKAIEHLRSLGYTIALDDFFYTDEYKPLVNLADIIKIDILDVGAKNLANHIRSIKSTNDRVYLLAEKVETREQYEYCKGLGMDFFQGYFFAKPQIIKGHRLPSNKMAILNLLASVYDPNVDMGELATIVGRDVGLSHKLLSFVKTYPGNQAVQINSIKDAVLRFGLQKLQSWVSVLVLSGMDDKPSELFNTALIRAKFMELLAEKAKCAMRDTYFMVGLFSCLDALMDTVMIEALSAMTIADEAKAALTTHDGVMGNALTCALAIEAGDINHISFLEINSGDISALYMQAMVWATATTSKMH